MYELIRFQFEPAVREEAVITNEDGVAVHSDTTPATVVLKVVRVILMERRTILPARKMMKASTTC